MLQKITFLFSLLIFFSTACNNSTTTSENAEESDGMAKFTKDEDFKNAHEEPKEIAFEGKGEMIEFETPDGKKGGAYAILSKEPTTKFLFVIHEWYGLNDHIKREAERLFDNLENVSVLALDIYDGKVAETRENASKYMNSVTDDRANSIIKGAMNYAGEGATFGTIGWCFGGGWSLKSSILAGEKSKACVIYYGMPVKTAKEIAPLKADVLGIFAANERWINPEVVANFEALAKATAKNLEVHSFDADHAFANPSSERYVEEAAQKANKLALDFLKARM